MMKRFSLIVLTCLLFGILTPQVFAQDAPKLQYKFTQGKTYRYRVILNMTLSSRSSSPGTGHSAPTAVQMMGIRSEQVKQVFPNGDAEIVYTFESMKIKNGSQWQDTPLGALPPMSMIISSDGIVKSTNGLDKAGPVGRMPFLNLENLNQYLGALPSVELKAGTSWTRNVPFPADGNNKSAGVMKMKGVIVSPDVKLENVPAVKYQQTVDGVETFSVPVPKTMAEKSSADVMNATGTIQTQSMNYFSPQMGCMLLTEGTGLAKLFAQYNNDKNQPVVGLNTGVIVKYQVFLIGN